MAGGDTASALAAGCPVVAKSHPSHLGISELAGRVIQQSVAACHLPEGVFSLLLGEGNAIGEALVLHPAIQAVGFTGSRRGGRALVSLAASRYTPIPVFAEMSSLNPVFLLPSALAQRAETIAQAFIDSVTLGVGQFCTKPGLAIAVADENYARFRAASQSAIAAKSAATMLNPAIHRAFCHGATLWANDPNLHALIPPTETPAHAAGTSAQPMLFSTSTKHFLQTRFQCRHIFNHGRRSASPCLTDKDFCYYHHTTRRPIPAADLKARKRCRTTFTLPSPCDLAERSGIQLAIGEVLQRIAANQLDPRRAGLLLYGLQIASLTLKTPPELKK